MYSQAPLFDGVWPYVDAGCWFQEPAGPEPSERLLQAIWQHQRVRRQALRTLDGREVRVLHPGFANRESGPDFHGAVLQIGAEPPRSGDVEIDLHPAFWSAHRHAGNPAFSQVLLHVVWNGTPPGPHPLPVLPLEPVLDAALDELAAWAALDGLDAWPAFACGACSSPLQSLAPDQVRALLETAARLRLRRKAALMEHRARRCGWDQAFWEGVFGALGYKHNRWPMLRLAELHALWTSRPGAAPGCLELQARLLGAGGLLPDLRKLPRSRRRFLRRLLHLWNQTEPKPEPLPRSVWRRHGVRPANHPQRRIALLAHWLAQGEFPARVLAWCRSDPHPLRLDRRRLEEVVQVGRDPFWSRHWTMASSRSSRELSLLGPARTTDLVMNVFLPWAWAQSAPGERQAIEARYFSWPPGERNAVLRLAFLRLAGSETAGLARTAAQQQGLMQIVRDFCERSDATCAACPFPGLVRQWLTARGESLQQKRAVR